MLEHIVFLTHINQLLNGHTLSSEKIGEMKQFLKSNKGKIHNYLSAGDWSGQAKELIEPIIENQLDFMLSEPPNSLSFLRIIDDISQSNAINTELNNVSIALLRHGADPFVPNRFNDCTFSYALRYKNTELAAFIIDTMPTERTKMLQICNDLNETNFINYITALEEKASLESINSNWCSKVMKL